MRSVNGLAQTSLIFVFLVIIAGSVVRMTGSGMGCPDWPKCFGHIVPPTNEEQVRWQANQSFDKDVMILQDDALWKAKDDFVSGESFSAENWEKYTRHDYAEFNVAHTWTEYINRLLGALSGVPVLLLFITSLIKIKKDWFSFALSAAAVFMLGYEAWLGKLVVDGNLVPFAVTKHMFGSLVLVALLIAIIARTSSRKKFEVTKGFKITLGITLLLLTTQILLGTQVREQIDDIARVSPLRETWIGLLDNRVLIHRSFSIALLVMLLWLFWRDWKDEYNLTSIGIVLAIAFLEAIGGAVMYYLNIPRFIQPTHLLLSAVMFAYLVWAFLRATSQKQ